MDNHQIKEVSVCVFLSISIIIVFSLYLTTAIKTIPCGKNLMSVFLSNFVHIDIYHLLINIFALYSLSRIERDIGSIKFISLIIFLLVFNSIFEVGVHKIFPKIPCSIGFSGILFGIMTWEIVTNKDLDLMLLGSIITMTILPSISNSKASLSGHIVGAVSGILGALLWKKILPNDIKMIRDKNIRKQK